MKKEGVHVNIQEEHKHLKAKHNPADKPEMEQSGGQKQ